MPIRGDSVFEIIPRNLPAWFRNPNLVCKQHPELFFPGQAETYKQRKAITLCNACPYRVRCAEYALDNDERFGVWGGTTARERARILSLRKVQPVAV